MFLVWSLDRVAKLYYLILECENARVNAVFLKLDISIGCHFSGLGLKMGISFRFLFPYRVRD